MPHKNGIVVKDEIIQRINLPPAPKAVKQNRVRESAFERPSVRSGDGSGAQER